MIGVAICTHASFAYGLKDAIEMIAGEQERLVAMGFTYQDELMEFSERLKAETKDFSDGCIYIVDMIHTSPFNAALICIYQTDHWVLSGACLPMLLEICILRNNPEYTMVDIVNMIKESSSSYLGYTSSDDVFK